MLLMTVGVGPGKFHGVLTGKAVKRWKKRRHFEFSNFTALALYGGVDAVVSRWLQNPGSLIAIVVLMVLFVSTVILLAQQPARFITGFDAD